MQPLTRGRKSDRAQAARPPLPLRSSVPSSLAIAAGVLFWSLAAAPSGAHELGVEYRIESGRLEVEAFYDDGSLAPNATVQLQDEGGTVIHSGTTDAAGRYAFEGVAAGAYRLLVEDATGHFARLRLTVDEAQAAPAVAPPAVEAAPVTGTEPEAAADGQAAADADGFGGALPLALAVVFVIVFGMTFLLAGRRGQGRAPS